MRRSKFKVGDWVIYRMTKYSKSPGPRALNVGPSANGDSYSYQVDKFWCIQGFEGEDKVVIRTRRGKTRLIANDDPLLRPARIWERLLFRGRFPKLKTGESHELPATVSVREHQSVS